MVTITNYNISNVTSGTGNPLLNLVRFVSNPDPATYSIFDYLIGHLILISIFAVIFLGLKAKGFNATASMTGAFSALLVVSILMYPLEIISGLALVICIVMFIVSITLVFFQGI